MSYVLKIILVLLVTVLRNKLVDCFLVSEVLSLPKTALELGRCAAGLTD